MPEIKRLNSIQHQLGIQKDYPQLIKDTYQRLSSCVGIQSNDTAT
jgi:hypothetical protein